MLGGLKGRNLKTVEVAFVIGEKSPIQDQLDILPGLEKENYLSESAL